MLLVLTSSTQYRRLRSSFPESASMAQALCVRSFPSGGSLRHRPARSAASASVPADELGAVLAHPEAQVEAAHVRVVVVGRPALAAELGVELVGAVVEGLEAASVVEVTVVGPGRDELLGQAA